MTRSKRGQKGSTSNNLPAYADVRISSSQTHTSPAAGSSVSISRVNTTQPANAEQYLAKSIIALQKLDSLLSSLPEGTILSLTQFLSANYYLSLAVNNWGKIFLSFPNSPIAQALKPALALSGQNAELYMRTHQDAKLARDGYLYSTSTGKIILQHEPERLTSAHLLNMHSQYEEYKNSITPAHLTWQNEFCKEGAILSKLGNILVNHDHSLTRLITPAATHTEAESDIASAFATTHNAHLLPHLTGAIVTGKYSYSDIDAAFFGKEPALMLILHYNTKLYLALADAGFSSSIAATYSLQAIGETVRILKSIGSDFIGEIGLEAAQQLILVRNKIAHATEQHSYNPSADLLKFICDQTSSIMPPPLVTVSAAGDEGVIETKAETTTINIRHNSSTNFSSNLTTEDTKAAAPIKSDDQLIEEARILTLAELASLERPTTNVTKSQEIVNNLLGHAIALFNPTNHTQYSKIVGNIIGIVNDVDFDLNCTAKVTLTAPKTTKSARQRTPKPLTLAEKITLQMELLDAIIKQNVSDKRIIQAKQHGIISSDDSGVAVLNISPLNLLIRVTKYLEKLEEKVVSSKGVSSSELLGSLISKQDYEHNLDQHFVSKMDVMTNPILLLAKLHQKVPSYTETLLTLYGRSFIQQMDQLNDGTLFTDTADPVGTFVKICAPGKFDTRFFNTFNEIVKLRLVNWMIIEHIDIANLTAALETIRDKSAKDQHGSTLLHRACIANNIDAVQLLLNAKVEKDAQDQEGLTPLHKTCEKGHLAIAKLLFEAGANKDAQNNHFGCTPLYLACQNGHTEIVKLLLGDGDGADKEAQTQSFTPLHIACQNGYTEIVNLLLAKGADISARSQDGVTPLDLACYKGHQEVVKTLLSYGTIIDDKARELAEVAENSALLKIFETHKENMSRVQVFNKILTQYGSFNALELAISQGTLISALGEGESSYLLKQDGQHKLTDITIVPLECLGLD